MKTKYLLLAGNDDSIDESCAMNEALKLANDTGHDILVCKRVATVHPIKRDTNELIDSFEAALKYLGRGEFNIWGISDKHKKAMTATYKLFTIAKLGTRRIISFLISQIVTNISISLGSCITIMLRGSCMRIRIIRLRVRLRVSVLGFAFQQANARNNSESNLLTCGMISYCFDNCITL